MGAPNDGNNRYVGAIQDTPKPTNLLIGTTKRHMLTPIILTLLKP